MFKITTAIFICLLMSFYALGQTPTPWFSALTKNSYGYVTTVPGGNTYYISPTGNDNNSGLTPALAVQHTLRAWGNSAYAGLLRAGKPDVLIFLPGTYNYLNLNSGLQGGSGDPAHPWFITGNFPGATTLPVVENYGITINKGSGSIVIDQFDFENYSHIPTSQQFNPKQGNSTTAVNLMAAGCNNVLVQNCRIIGYDNGISVQNLDPTTGWTTFGGPIYGFISYRNYIGYSLSMDSTHTQAIYMAGCYAPLIQECVFDHNGWYPATQPNSPTGFTLDMFKHNIYDNATGDNSPIMSVGIPPWDNNDISTLTNNCFFNGGDSTENRHGCVESYDLYRDNAWASHFGQRPSSFMFNVISGSNTIPGSNLGGGVEEEDAPIFTCSNNIFGPKNDSINYQAAMLCDSWGTYNWANTTRSPVTSWTNNIVDNWTGYAFSTDSIPSPPVSIPNITFTNNKINNAALIRLGGIYDPTDIFANNQYATTNPTPDAYNADALYSPETISVFINQTHDSSVVTSSVLPPVDRVLSYAQSLGFATVSQFESACDYNVGTLESLHNNNLTAFMANIYIKNSYISSTQPVHIIKVFNDGSIQAQ